MNLPTHKCGLYLSHNEHLDYYESISEWLKGQGDHYSFESEASKATCIASNDCWTLQWYPNTPVSFIAIAAPTLEELLAYAEKVENQQTL